MDMAKGGIDPTESSVISPLAPRFSGSTIDDRPHDCVGLCAPLIADHLKNSSSSVPLVEKSTLPRDFSYETVFLNLACDFDADVDDIFGLNLESERNFFKNDGDLECSTSAGASGLKPFKRRISHEGEGGTPKGLRKDEQRDENDRDDEGYCSMSNTKDHNGVQNSPTQWTDVASTPKDACHCESSGQGFVFSAADLCPAPSGTRIKPAKSELLEGDVEEFWNIGSPAFESTVCHSVTATSGSDSDAKRRARENAQPSNRDLQGPDQESSFETSCKTTLPPQVQGVKERRTSSSGASSGNSDSTPSRPSSTCSSSTSHSSSSSGISSGISSDSSDFNSTPSAASPPPDLKVSHHDQHVHSGRSERPRVSDRNFDWETEKQSYFRLVTKHIENPEGQGVMSELFSLMAHTAEQNTADSGVNGGEWLHPADLTRRNYQRRVGNVTPKMSLGEWQKKNSESQARFAKVPKVFQRSLSL